MASGVLAINEFFRNRILFSVVGTFVMDDDILLLAKEDAMGKALQDLSLNRRKRASKNQ